MSSLLLLIVIVLLCVGSLVNKQSVRLVHPFTIQWMQGIVCAGLVPVWYFLNRKFAPESTFSREAFSLSVSGALISSLAFLLFLTALKDKPVCVATAFLSTYPALTMVFVSVTQNEKLSIPRIVGIGSILFGIMVIQIWDK